jgi:hypothetical protein
MASRGGGWWHPEESTRPVTSKVIDPSCRGGDGVEELAAEEAPVIEEVVEAWRNRL